MGTIEPYETDLVGVWKVVNGRVVGDETSRRIGHLIADSLVKIASSPDGWTILYQDPQDGRLWELTYPQSGSHGGGPPRLTYITGEDAALRYGL
jgi:immunity protein 27 of polymorphic toxin system